MDSADCFEWGNSLGAGGGGCVYSGKLKSSGEMVALKRLRGSLSDKTISEFSILEGLKHPNIVSMKALFLDASEGCPVLVMEFIDGVNLKQHLNLHGVFDIESAHSVFTQLLHAVNFLHNKGIAHRDIKLVNVMISANGIVKLVDFGGSKRPEGLADNSVVGTVGLMAPEMTNAQRGSGKYTDCFALDIWGLGLVLFEMIAGKLPSKRISKRTKSVTSSSFQEGSCVGDSSFETWKFDLSDIPKKEIRAVIRACLIEDPILRATAVDLARMDWLSKGGSNSTVKDSGELRDLLRVERPVKIAQKSNVHPDEVGKAVIKKLQGLGPEFLSKRVPALSHRGEGFRVPEPLPTPSFSPKCPIPDKENKSMIANLEVSGFLSESGDHLPSLRRCESGFLPDENETVLDIRAGVRVNVFSDPVLVKYSSPESRKDLMKRVLMIVREKFGQEHLDILDVESFQEFVRKISSDNDLATTGQNTWDKGGRSSSVLTPVFVSVAGSQIAPRNQSRRVSLVGFETKDHSMRFVQNLV